MKEKASEGNDHEGVRKDDDTLMMTTMIPVAAMSVVVALMIRNYSEHFVRF